MKDWDRNGRIDARDRYLFHEVILKEDTMDQEPVAGRGCSRTYTPADKPKSKSIKEMSGLEILGWTVFGILAMIGFIVG